MKKTLFLVAVFTILFCGLAFAFDFRTGGESLAMSLDRSETLNSILLEYAKPGFAGNTGSNVQKGSIDNSDKAAENTASTDLKLDNKAYENGYKYGYSEGYLYGFRDGYRDAAGKDCTEEEILKLREKNKNLQASDLSYSNTDVFAEGSSVGSSDGYIFGYKDGYDSGLEVLKAEKKALEETKDSSSDNSENVSEGLSKEEKAEETLSASQGVQIDEDGNAYTPSGVYLGKVSDESLSILNSEDEGAEDGADKTGSNKYGKKKKASNNSESGKNIITFNANPYALQIINLRTDDTFTSDYGFGANIGYRRSFGIVNAGVEFGYSHFNYDEYDCYNIMSFMAMFGLSNKLSSKMFLDTDLGAGVDLRLEEGDSSRANFTALARVNCGYMLNDSFGLACGADVKFGFMDGNTKDRQSTNIGIYVNVGAKLFI